jgi:alpha-tubulin suppressor-like RCC1 family protein
MPGIKNVVLIDIAVAEHKLFADSCNSSTLPVVYSSKTTRNEISSKIAKLGSVERIAFVFHEPKSTYTFLDNEPLFSEGSKLYSSKNALFLVDMFKKHQVKNADFLACNTLKQSSWKTFYDVLKKNTGTVVGASDDATGNLKYGGDWVMESTQENVKNIYFTNDIGDYSGLLISPGNSLAVVDGTAFGAGLNEYGELGMGNKQSLDLFTEVSSLVGVSVVSIESGANFALALSADGKVYGSGVGPSSSGISYKGGLPETNEFTLVPELIGINVSKISCGDYHSLVVDDTGKVYVTGSNGQGRIGAAGGDGLGEFTQATDLDGIIIVDVACGSAHSLVLDDAGTMYAAGANWSCQLGTGDTHERTSFTLVQAPVPMSSIACGLEHSLAMGADGQLYGTGSNVDGRLGLGQNGLNIQNGFIAIPTAPSVTNLSSVDIAAGSAFTLFAADGVVYATGLNNRGQLGFATETSSLNSFTQVPSLSGVQLRADAPLSAGYAYSIVIASDGTIYGSGANTFGQLGTGNTEDVTVFQPAVGTGPSPHVATAAGYATEISNEVPTYQNLTPSPTDLQTSSSNEVANAQAVNYDTNMTVQELEGKKSTVQGYLNTITGYKTTLEGYLNNINVVLANAESYMSEMDGWLLNADGSLSQSDIGSIQASRDTISADYASLGAIKTNIENAITAVSGDVTTVNGILSDIDAKIAVVTSTGYANTISSELTAQQNLSPSPAALESESNGLISAASSIVSTTTTPENILQSNYDTVQGYYNTIGASETTLEGYLADINTVLANGNTYKTAMSGYLADGSITGTDRSSIQSSYDSVSSNVTELEAIKVNIENALGVVSADFVTIGVLFTQVGGVLNAVVCFPGDTPVTTDQGEIQIKELVAGKHTIDGKRIKYITKVVNEESTLTCIRRNAIDEGVPSRKTLITNEHPVEFHGEMVQAGELVDMVDGAFKVKYNGEPVYNVVMEKKDTMMVNGLRCETLDPKSRCLLAMMLCERVMSEQNPAKKAKLGMGLRKVLKKMKLEDIRKRSHARR